MILDSRFSVDGIYSQNSRWAAANSDLPIWLDIDFGGDTTFNKVVLTENIVSGWASPRIASFNLQIPTVDGYQTIYTYDGEIGEGKDFTFDTVTASHLRMEITSLRADTSTHGRGETDPSIVEFEVYKVPSFESRRICFEQVPFLPVLRTPPAPHPK